MGHEQRLGGHDFRRGPILAGRLCDQVGKGPLDVFHVQASAVKSRVGKPAGEKLREWDNSPLRSHVRAFKHQAHRAHAHDHSVATPIKWQRGILDVARRCRCTGGQETRPHPLQKVVRGDIIGPQDNHTLTAPQADPILRDSNALRGGGAGCVDLSVGSFRLNELGKLGVPHGQDLKQEPAIEVAVLIVAIAGQPLSKPIQAGKGRGKQHPGRLSHGLWQRPTGPHLGTGCGDLVGANQGDSSIAKGLNPCPKSQLGGAIQGLLPASIHPILFHQIKFPGTPRKLDHFLPLQDGLKRPLASLVLDQAHHSLGDHPVLDFLGNDRDAVFAIENGPEVVIVKHALTAGKPDGGPRADHLDVLCGGVRRTSHRVRHLLGHIWHIGRLKGLHALLHQGFNGREQRLCKACGIQPLDSRLGNGRSELREVQAWHIGRGTQRGSCRCCRRLLPPNRSRLHRNRRLGPIPGRLHFSKTRSKVVADLPDSSVVRKQKPSLSLQPKVVPESRHNLRLANRVDAQIRLEVPVEFDSLGRKPGALGQRALHRRNHPRVGPKLGLGLRRRGRAEPGLRGSEDVRHSGRRRFSHRKPQRQEPRQSISEGPNPPKLGLVCIQGTVGPVLQDGHSKPGQGPLGSTLHKDSSTI